MLRPSPATSLRDHRRVYSPAAECPLCKWRFDRTFGIVGVGHFMLEVKCERRSCGRRCLMLYAREAEEAPPHLLGTSLLPSSEVPDRHRVGLLRFRPHLPEALVHQLLHQAVTWARPTEAPHG